MSYSRPAVAAAVAALEREGYTRNQAILIAFNSARAAYFKRYPQGALPEWLAYPKGRRLAQHYAPNGAPMRERVENNPKGRGMSLWRYNRRSGYWDHMRNVTPETAQQWLDTFCADEPGEQFKLATNKPTARPETNPVRKPADTERARRLLEGFTESPTAFTKLVDMPDFRVGLTPGRILGIIYETRIAGEPKRYIHQFRKIKSRPLLVVSSDGKQFRSLGGGFRFTDRGFVDD